MFTEWQINVELPMVKDYSPPAAVNSSVFPELEFGRSKEFYLLFLQQCGCTSGPKRNEEYQIKVIFALENSAL